MQYVPLFEKIFALKTATVLSPAFQKIEDYLFGLALHEVSSQGRLTLEINGSGNEVCFALFVSQRKIHCQ